ncbi:MAG: hypothetical protein NZ108_07810, partial [Bacteroidia bacterium]|nr:hypothetical protein [Bacteroidia bacterium]
VHRLFIRRDVSIKYIIIGLTSGYIIYAIKPYIIFSYIPLAIFWIALENQRRVGNPLVRVVLAPLIVTGGAVGGLFALQSISSSSTYSLDNVLHHAYTHQQDLLKNTAYYEEGGGSTFDIGEYDPTLTGALSKLPIAVFTTFYRPMLWDVRNPIMFFSAVENTYLLYLTFLIFRNMGLRGLWYGIRNHPFIFFCFSFSIAFGFSVGLSTSNFGSLVRYKIPCIPFYFAMLYMCNYLYNITKQQDKDYKRMRAEQIKSNRAKQATLVRT